jgi:ankyrin repeat protein
LVLNLDPTVQDESIAHKIAVTAVTRRDSSRTSTATDVTDNESAVDSTETAAMSTGNEGSRIPTESLASLENTTEDNVVQNLLGQFVKKGDVTAKDVRGNTSLHLACFEGDLPIVILRVEGGANKEERNELLCTPLHYACSAGHLDVVKWSVDNGASVGVLDKGGLSPLQHAEREGHVSIVAWLTERDSTNAEEVKEVCHILL